MSNMIKREAAKKYKDAELLALGGFFFLRFVCPPLSNPNKFGLINKGMQLRMQLVVIIILTRL